MTIVTISKHDSQITVKSPINGLFIEQAKKLGGKWHPNQSAWVFDARDEARVRELCMRYYGSDGLTDDVVTLRVKFTATGYANRNSYMLYGRPVARAFGRDSGAKQGDGVVFLQGGCTSGGSMKNWDTRIRAGSEVLIRDFPRKEAEELVADQEPDADPRYTIEPETVPVDVPALTTERTKLLNRIAEIDAILAVEAQAEDYARNCVERALTNGAAAESRFADSESR